jgi:hypothetical protein
MHFVGHANHAAQIFASAPNSHPKVLVLQWHIACVFTVLEVWKLVNIQFEVSPLLHCSHLHCCTLHHMIVDDLIHLLKNFSAENNRKLLHFHCCALYFVDTDRNADSNKIIWSPFMDWRMH